MTSVYQFPHFAMKNRQMVFLGTTAGCFSCLKIFNVKEITEFTDNNQTVLCPACKTDSVIGDTCGFTLNEEILKKANQFWYKKS